MTSSRPQPNPAVRRSGDAHLVCVVRSWQCWPASAPSITCDLSGAAPTIRPLSFSMHSHGCSSWIQRPRGISTNWPGRTEWHSGVPDWRCLARPDRLGASGIRREPRAVCRTSAVHPAPADGSDTPSAARHSRSVDRQTRRSFAAAQHVGCQSGSQITKPAGEASKASLLGQSWWRCGKPVLRFRRFVATQGEGTVGWRPP